MVTKIKFATSFLLIFVANIAFSNNLVINEIKKHIKDKNNIDTLVALAFVESSFKVKAKGGIGEQGLWQLHPKFFKLKNWTVKEQTQIAERHLTFVKKYCKVDVSICWNLGIMGANKLKDPKNYIYYKKYKKARIAYGTTKKQLQDKRIVTSDKFKIFNNKNINEKIRAIKRQSIARAL